MMYRLSGGFVAAFKLIMNGLRWDLGRAKVIQASSRFWFGSTQPTQARQDDQTVGPNQYVGSDAVREVAEDRRRGFSYSRLESVWGYLQNVEAGQTSIGSG